MRLRDAPGVLRELTALLFGRRRWFRVRGDSMAPGLSPGDAVLVDPAAPIDVGDVVVVADPERRDHHLVKRVGSRGRSTFALRSDNPHGARDSRHFGSVAPERIIGRVELVFTHDGALRLIAAPDGRHRRSP